MLTVRERSEVNPPMAAAKDYYKILGVDRKAADKDIKLAYRKLARQFHPDVNKGDKAAEARFKEINEAYSVLSDKDKRSRYDQFGPDFEQAARAGANPFARGGARSAGFEGGGNPFGAGGFSDLFGDLFSRAGGGFQGGGGFGGGHELPRDVEAPIDVSLEEVARGGRQSFQVNREDACHACQGSGRQGRNACTTCFGRAVVNSQRTIAVDIPKGVREGTRIRLRGEGGTVAGGRSRDLYLVVRLLAHPTFELKGDDLELEVPLAVTEAVLGASVTVPLLRGGKVTLQIPPGTSSGRKLRMSGLGMPAATADGKAGDLYVRVRIEVPTDLSAEERELYRKLASLRPHTPRDPQH